MSKSWRIHLMMGAHPRLTGEPRRKFLRRLKAQGVKKSRRVLAAIRQDLSFFASMRLLHGDEEATFYIWGCLEPLKPPPEAMVPITEGFTSKPEGFSMFLRRMKKVCYGGNTLHQCMQYALYGYLVGRAHGQDVGAPPWVKFMYWVCGSKRRYQENRVDPFFRDMLKVSRRAKKRKELDFQDAINASLREIAQQRAIAKEAERRTNLKKKKRRVCPRCDGAGWYSRKGKPRDCKKCGGRGWLKRKKKQA